MWVILLFPNKIGLCIIRITNAYFGFFFEKYQNGSRPDGKTTQAEVDEIKSLLFNMVEKTKSDFEAGVFQRVSSVPNQNRFLFGNFK